MRSAAVEPADSDSERLPQLHQVDEVARMLGVSRRRVYELTSTNALPHYRIGRSLRVSQADLLVFLARSRSAGEQP